MKEKSFIECLEVIWDLPVTHSSTAKREEKQDERGSCQTLQAIEKH